MILERSRWSIETAGWNVSIDPECVALEPADCDAALQISAFAKGDGDFEKDEMLELADSFLNGRGSLTECEYGDFQGYAAEYSEPDEEGEMMFTRVYFLADGELHLFITYNSNLEDSQRHTEVLKWMLGSLKKRVPAV